MTVRTNHLDQPIGFPVPGWTGATPPARTPMQGRTVRLEPLDAAAHGGDLFAAYGADAEGRLWTYLPAGPFNDDRPGFDAWLKGCEASADPLFFTAIDQTNGTALGVASYLRIEPKVGVIEVGFITFSPALQRTVMATETMFLMMARVFDALGYRRYEWKCDNLNAPSNAAAKRLGFSYEGLFRQATIYKGRNRDTAWYSILDTEWPALKTAFETWLDSANFDAEGRQRISLSELTRAALVQPGA
ncbi:MAG: GNAT family N-acetyltransferase [Alphaproteobacteria bacterium]|nr:GNAT family N-acetyltransferase [Alphaproteobacteria bacterium]